MFACTRIVLAVVVPLIYLPSAYVYAQSAPIEAAHHQEGGEDTSEPARQSPIQQTSTQTVPQTAPQTLPQSSPQPAQPSLPQSLDQLSPAYGEQSILPKFGKVMFYNPGIMEIVIENRIKAADISSCHDCIGYAALLRKGDLDRKIWIEFSDGLVEGPFHVVDVAAPQHVLMLLGKEWVADVDYETAMRWRMAGPRWATVHAQPPAGYRSPLDLQPYDLLESTDLLTAGVYYNEKLTESYMTAEDSLGDDELFVR